MADWPTLGMPLNGPVMSVCTPDSLGHMAPNLAVPTSAAWPTANLAIFYPFRIVRPYFVKRLFCFNGAAVAGNIDMGIYDETGRRLVSVGPTAQAGTSQRQYFDVTDTMLAPGQFFWALVSSSTSSTFFRFAPFAGLVLTACYQQASAGTLPATATWTTNTPAYIAVCGHTSRAA